MVCAGIYIDVCFGDVNISLQADTSRDFFQRAAMVYDAQRERLALIEEEYVSGTDELYKDILLYELVCI